MRLPRFKAPESHPSAFYHCTSRVVDRRFAFHDREKDQFVSYLNEYQAFCGVHVVTFCVMSNHFHVLVQVPPRPKTLPDDEELLRRLEALCGLGGGRKTRQQLEALRQAGHHAAAQALRERVLARMWNLSAFMKLLKQRFTQWFNLTHHRSGTLWEGRFKSVLVEGTGEILATVAAYIDLNCVRAGLAADPKDYRWSGYAQAMAGSKACLEGLRRASAGLRGLDPQTISLAQGLMDYRVCLFGKGEQNSALEAPGQPLRKGIAREEVARVVGAKGRVPLVDYLRLRVRYFTDGAVLGSRAFVEAVFQAHRHRFGPKRKTGARRLRGVQSLSLFCLRDLRLNLWG
ncbi:MAG: transposase, partial [Verrucomicrobia bacterium]|nr:transposase [Verrucomicrobiota bacterium]MBI3869486.1 transposase [Verrucomicrobiota bacterium]